MRIGLWQTLRPGLARLRRGMSLPERLGAASDVMPCRLGRNFMGIPESVLPAQWKVRKVQGWSENAGRAEDESTCARHPVPATCPLFKAAARGWKSVGSSSP